MLIDFVPDSAGVSLAESKGFLKAPGGAPANVACAITKLGGTSAFIGKVSPSPPPPPLYYIYIEDRSLIGTYIYRYIYKC